MMELSELIKLFKEALKDYFFAGDLTTLKIRKLEAEVIPGPSFRDITHEGALLALRSNCTVKFEYNGFEYTFSPDTIRQCATKLEVYVDKPRVAV